MARTISLDQACRRIETALKKYAQSKGWRRPDYVLVVRASEWESVHILLAAKAFKDEEGFAARDEAIHNYLTQEVGREVPNQIGLLHTMSLAKYKRMELGDHMREIAEKLDLTEKDLQW